MHAAAGLEAGSTLRRTRGKRPGGAARGKRRARTASRRRPQGVSHRGAGARRNPRPPERRARKSRPRGRLWV